jgi:non-structural maintenance of chromosomes element 1
MQRNRNCPICKAEWDDKHFVGEKVITTSEQYLQGKRRSGGNRRARQEAEQEVEQEAEQEANGNERD